MAAAALTRKPRYKIRGNKVENFLNTWRPRILSLLRTVTAFLFMQHGTQKTFGFPAPQHYEFELFSLSWVTGILLEVLGGFLILRSCFPDKWHLPILSRMHRKHFGLS